MQNRSFLEIDANEELKANDIKELKRTNDTLQNLFSYRIPTFYNKANVVRIRTLFM